VNLCTIVVRTIHLTLFPELSTVTHNFSFADIGIERTEHELRMKDFERTKIRLKEQYVTNPIYPHLFGLLDESCVSSLATGIIIEKGVSGIEEWALLEAIYHITWNKHIVSKFCGIDQQDHDIASGDTDSTEKVNTAPMKKSRKLKSSSPTTGSYSEKEQSWCRHKTSISSSASPEIIASSIACFPSLLLSIV